MGKSRDVAGHLERGSAQKERVRIWWRVGECVVIAVSAAAIAGIALIPVSVRESDWAAIYTMRWSALAAIFTTVSAVAIGLTAIYARQTIGLSRRAERVKHTLELLAAYRRDGVYDAFIRYENEQLGSNYTRLRLMRDIDQIIAYFEDAAVQIEADIVDCDLFMRQMADIVEKIWGEFFDRPKYQIKNFSGHFFPEFTALKDRARRWSSQRARSAMRG